MEIPLVKIPDGGDYYTFLMGTAGDNGDETQHKVKLTKAFRMSKYQVTNVQWCAFLDAWNVANSGSEITDVNNQGKYNTNWSDDASWFSLPASADAWVIQIEYVGGNRPFINVSHQGAEAE